MSSRNLKEKLLAERWNIRPATLRQWRWKEKGPKSFKIGGRVLYKTKEVEKFEEQAVRNNTAISDDMEVS